MKKFILSVALIMSLAMPFNALNLVSADHAIATDSKKALLNNTYFDLSTGSLSQDWTNAGLITANDNWSGVPSVLGFLGQDMTTATATDPQTILTGASALLNDLDVLANQSAPNTQSQGGVIEFDGIPDPSIALNGSGTADAPHIVLYANATGRQAVNVSYNARDLDGSTDNAVMPVALQYRVGETGDFTNVPVAFIADASSGPSLATLVTPVNVTLPAAVNNQAQVQIRIISSNAAGNDEAIGIDDIVVSSSAAGGNAGSIQLTSATNSVPEGAPSLTITATRTGGTSGAVGVSYATTNGSATSGVCSNSSTADYNAVSGTLSWADGDAADKTFNITLCDDAEFEGNETFGAILSSATGGATLGAPSTSIVTIEETDAEPTTISFANSSVSEEESQSAYVEIVRTGDTSGASTVHVAAIESGSATDNPLCGLGGDFVSIQGDLTFAPGVTSRIFPVPLCADAFAEGAESFQAVLSSPTGAVLGANPTSTVLITDTASQYRNPEAFDFEDNAQQSSSIVVSGQAGPVGTVRVTLYDVTHLNTGDLDVLLVGPDGRQIILMSDSGTNGPSRSITFTDNAGQVLPQSAPIETGNYEPTSWTPGQPNFNAPAPAGPYNEPGSTVGGGPNLTSVFNGGTANGTWTIYVRDDNGAAVKMGGSNGSMAGGWGLDIISQPASAAAISGTVLDLQRRPIRGAIVQLSGPGLPQPVIMVSNTFGRFTFTGLQAGQQYTLQASSRRHVISPTTATFTLNSSLSDVVLVGLP